MVSVVLNTTRREERLALFSQWGSLSPSRELASVTDILRKRNGHPLGKKTQQDQLSAWFLPVEPGSPPKVVSVGTMKSSVALQINTELQKVGFFLWRHKLFIGTE